MFILHYIFPLFAENIGPGKTVQTIKIFKGNSLLFVGNISVYYFISFNPYRPGCLSYQKPKGWGGGWGGVYKSPVEVLGGFRHFRSGFIKF